MQKASLVQIQRDLRKLKKFVTALDKKVGKMAHPIIIEKFDEDALTPAEKRHLKRVRDDIKKGRLDKYISIEEFRAKYGV